MRPFNLIDKAFLLKRTKLFGSLDLDLLLTIADKMEMTFYKQGGHVFQLDQDANHMYLIAYGRVSITGRDQQAISTLHDGDFFGDEAIFNGRGRGYGALCLSDALLIHLSRAHLLAIIAECPSVAINLLEAYSDTTDFRAR